jgi:2-dehydro-3-deoxyphosphogluconate aldolase/(4S)-4-hydroxy-2-oxoglutarate aldolase
MKKAEVRARIQGVGIIPGVRVATAENARFAAEAVNRSGIPIVEITMTVPGALEVIAHLANTLPEMVAGAGTVPDGEAARRCQDAGAMTTPTDLIAAWKMGADFVKIYPCGPLGGPSYIRALKLPFPQVPLIATGGVNQRTAGDFILNGATALGIGWELINPEGLPMMQEQRIRELARRYLKIVQRDGA